MVVDAVHFLAVQSDMLVYTVHSLTQLFACLHSTLPDICLHSTLSDIRVHILAGKELQVRITRQAEIHEARISHVCEHTVSSLQLFHQDRFRS